MNTPTEHGTTWNGTYFPAGTFTTQEGAIFDMAEAKCPNGHPSTLAHWAPHTMASFLCPVCGWRYDEPHFDGEAAYIGMAEDAEVCGGTGRHDGQGVTGCDECQTPEAEALADPGPHYVAGWNMPGYLPESVPEAFPDFDSARAYLDGTLERLESDPDECDGTAIEAGAARNYFASALVPPAPGEEMGTQVGTCVYWVQCVPGPCPREDDGERWP